MKARLLKKLLNNTGYSISNHDKYIAIGSPMCHDLIRVDKKTLKLTYALDTFGEGRAAINHPPLELIWDKMIELIESREIIEIIEGKDEIKNPLPVFTVVDGRLVESVTDKYGWPNTDDNGVIMYDNTHFPTKQQAIEYGITEYEAAVSLSDDMLNEKEKELSEVHTRRDKYQGYVNHLKKQLQTLNP